MTQVKEIMTSPVHDQAALSCRRPAKLRVTGYGAKYPCKNRAATLHRQSDRIGDPGSTAWGKAESKAGSYTNLPPAKRFTSSRSASRKSKVGSFLRSAHWISRNMRFSISPRN